MDEQKVRDHAQTHAESVRKGDMDAVAADLVEDLRPMLPEVGKLLPQPVTQAEVLDIEFAGEEATARIRYAGDAQELTIRSQWREIDGRPMIVAVEPLT
jgi:hypothetical protein